jgi:hypothetical protein
MTELAPSAAVVAAYEPSILPVSDRALDLIEAPLGAMTLLAGCRRQREGGPLSILVRQAFLHVLLPIDLHTPSAPAIAK